MGEIALTPVAHPVLYDIGNESILTFLRDREAYERVMTDRRKAGSTTEPVSLKASVYPKLLASLLMLKEIRDASAEALNDNAVEE